MKEMPPYRLHTMPTACSRWPPTRSWCPCKSFPTATARMPAMLKGAYGVGRVIVRPLPGQQRRDLYRTHTKRHDLSSKPPSVNCSTC